MQKRITQLLWLLPLCLQSGDAFAWGLYTHVYFAQLLVWAIPLLDPRFRGAAKRLPELVMIGACLPDLALVGKRVGTEAFQDTHRWETAHRLLADAETDEELAFALGFGSHLLVDVIAHNHFVPAHETLWLDLPMVTHVASEWAMDVHIQSQLFAFPGYLLSTHKEMASRFAVTHFGCTPDQALQAIMLLSRADRVLRRSGLPHAIYQAAKVMDRALPRRFDYYVDETSSRLNQINRVLEGHVPAWAPELLCEETKRERMRAYSLRQLRHRLPLPQDLF